MNAIYRKSGRVGFSIRLISAAAALGFASIGTAVELFHSSTQSIVTLSILLALLALAIHALAITLHALLLERHESALEEHSEELQRLFNLEVGTNSEGVPLCC